MNQITFTIYKSTEPLSKIYWTESGVIHKQAAAQIHTATAGRVTLPFANFAEALTKATDKQAFGYGSHPLNYPNKVKIAVSGKEQPDKNIISRTQKFYKYLEQPGVVMIDHDPNEYGQTMAVDALLAALIAIHPDIAPAARVVRGSVSAGVHKTGESPRTDKGFHIYIPVNNAADIPRYGKVLFDRLWLAGFGFIALASNGAALVRTVIDGAVFSPERLDFVGKPIINGTDLEYTPPAAIYTEGGLLDTETLPDLTEDQKAEVKRLIADAKEAIKPTAATKQTAWAAAKVETMAAAGVPVEKARAAIKQLLSGGCQDLYDDFIIEFTTGAVSVSDALKNPKAYDGKALADPVEGIAYGATTAKFYWNNGKPFINSQAHGSGKYFLHQTPVFSEHPVGAPDRPKWKIELDAHVERWNKKHASVVTGGKHRIMRKINGNATHDGRAAYEFFNRKELELVHDNTLIKVGEKVVRGELKEFFSNHLMAWAKHPKSLSFTGGVVFLPGRNAPANHFNTWRGFSVDPQQNDKLLKPIYYHMKAVVCSGNQDLYDYFINWIAYTIQNPDKPAGAAIVLRGDKGSGKGTIGHFLKDLWGNHGLHISNAKHLVGNFNGHLNDVCFLFADEAFYSGDKQHEGVLKALITEPQVTIERKGIDAISQPNYLKILMATNSGYAVPATKDERRYCVMDVSSERIGDRDYFNVLHTACASKAVQAAFLYAMQHIDLTSWHTGDIPDSVGLREQRYHSMDSVQKWIVDALINGSFKTPCHGDSWQTELSSKDLFEQFIVWCDTAKAGEYRRVSQCLMGRYLSDVFEKVTRGGGYAWYYFGSLDNAISRFEAFERVSLSELSK